MKPPLQETYAEVMLTRENDEPTLYTDLFCY